MSYKPISNGISYVKSNTKSDSELIQILNSEKKQKDMLVIENNSKDLLRRISSKETVDYSSIIKSSLSNSIVMETKDDEFCDIINKRNKILENGMCPLCKDFLNENNQIEEWNEIHEILYKCYKKKDPSFILFGKEESDLEQIKKEYIQNGLENWEEGGPNLSMNNNCVIQ